MQWHQFFLLSTGMQKVSSTWFRSDLGERHPTSISSLRSALMQRRADLLKIGNENGHQADKQISAGVQDGWARGGRAADCMDPSGRRGAAHSAGQTVQADLACHYLLSSARLSTRSEKPQWNLPPCGILLFLFDYFS